MKQKDFISRSKDIPSSTHLPGNGARKELRCRSVSASFLTSPLAAPEKSLMSVRNLLLVDVVGPPSAEVCRTIANFPQVDDLRFINPWEA